MNTVIVEPGTDLVLDPDISPGFCCPPPHQLVWPAPPPKSHDEYEVNIEKVEVTGLPQRAKKPVTSEYHNRSQITEHKVEG